MQIVIDIPENTVNEIKDNAMFAKPIADHIKWDVTSAIVNGTPLPKGHGRLIDADEVDDTIYKCFEDIQFYDGTGYDIYSESKENMDKIPTIIEADKEQEDDNT